MKPGLLLAEPLYRTVKTAMIGRRYAALVFCALATVMEEPLLCKGDDFVH